MTFSTAGSLVVRSKRTSKRTAFGPPSKRRRVTAHALPHQDTFPFLDLPAELRNVIYSLCINMDGIATYLKAFLERYKNCMRPKQIRPKSTHLKTPAVLLINRQIHAEAVGYIEKVALVFDHGIFTHLKLTKLICRPALQRIRSITITGDVKEFTDRVYGVQSWCGYVNLLRQLAWYLKNKHQLQELNIHFPECEHTGHCWSGSWACGFRDSLREALEEMCDIRGVSKVCITGLPVDITRELTRRMTTAPLGFLNLPRELRDMVYDHVVGEWPDVSGELDRMIQKWPPTLSYKPPYPELVTPGILLVNRTISKEAFTRRNKVFDKPLTITFPTQGTVQQIRMAPSILAFIQLQAMQHVKHLTLDFRTWEWTLVVAGFVTALRGSHSLETLTIKFKDPGKPFRANLVRMHYPEDSLHGTIGHLARLNGVGRVNFIGDLPSCYTAPLQMIMQGTYAERRVPIIYAEFPLSGKLCVLDTPWL